MATGLDSIRRQYSTAAADGSGGARFTGPPGGAPRLAQVVAAGGAVPVRFPDHVRWYLAAAVGAAGLVTGVHQLAFRAWSTSSNHFWRDAADVIGWPTPLAQTVVGAAGGAALVVLFAWTWGFTRVRPALAWMTVATAAAASLGAAPLLAVLAIVAVFFVIVGVLGVLLIFMCFAALADA